MIYHINAIENFWSYVKHRFQKFKGLKFEYFYLINRIIEIILFKRYKSLLFLVTLNKKL